MQMVRRMFENQSLLVRLSVCYLHTQAPFVLLRACNFVFCLHIEQMTFKNNDSKISFTVILHETLHETLWFYLRLSLTRLCGIVMNLYIPEDCRRLPPSPFSSFCSIKHLLLQSATWLSIFPHRHLSTIFHGIKCSNQQPLLQSSSSEHLCFSRIYHADVMWSPTSYKVLTSS